MEDANNFIQIMENYDWEARGETDDDMDKMMKTTVLHGNTDVESGREIRRSMIKFKHDQMKNLTEEFDNEELNRDYAITLVTVTSVHIEQTEMVCFNVKRRTFKASDLTLKRDAAQKSEYHAIHNAHFSQ